MAWGYVGSIVVCFVAAPLLKGQFPSTTATIWLLLAVWLAGWSLGHYVTGRLTASADARRPPSSRRPLDPLLPSAVLMAGILSLVVQVFLVRAGGVGYGVQVRGDVSVGWLPVFSSIGPVALASAFTITLIHAASSGRRVFVASLVLLQAVALAATGFKGAGPLYLLIVWLVVKRWRPSTRWRPRRIAIGAVAVVMMLALFEFAANVRRDISAAATTEARASGLAAFLETPALALRRVDLLTSAHPAVERAERPEAKETVSVQSQLVSYVPRALWPDKPVTNYGHDVSTVFFDIPEFYRTSSSITWVGDLFVQGGPTLVFVVALLGGVAFNRVLRWRVHANPITVSCYFLAAQILLTLESPLLISLATALRTFVTLILAVYGIRFLLQLARSRRGSTSVVQAYRPLAETIG